ncbi:MAG: immune inhibitor A, partial [Candidatus Eisenbacteria bacterium]|nr:immune inhibitor A [Candidatus Eisenbacteria bacterium]
MISEFAPPAFLSEALKKRAAPDCFGRPSAALLERFGSLAPASRLSVSGVTQSPVVLRALVLRVDFLSDRTGSLTTSEGGRFDLRNGATAVIDPPPHNRDYFAAHMQALSRYYLAMTDSHVVIQASVFPAAQDSAFHLSDTADYGPWTYSETDYEIAVRLITDAVNAADQSSEPIVFSEYDLVYIFHAGADLQGDIDGDSYNDIPSFTAGLEEPVPVDGGSSYVYAATVLPETVTQDGLTGAINGVIAHESGHMLGLPDLYNTEDFLPSVGYWSLMDTGNYLSGYVWDPTVQDYVYVFGLVPGGLDPYCRRELGRLFGVPALEEVVVEEAWADTLFAVESSYRVLKVPVNAAEYFLVENRQSELDGNGEIVVTTDPATAVILGPESNEYDALLPGSGILIWHVDENVISSRACEGLCPNGGPQERGIDVEEADGIEDLGDPASWEWLGSEFDPYFVGNATLFTPSTVPNSDANSGTSSDVYVEVTSPRAVGMRVSVERQWARPGWPAAARGLSGAVPGFEDFDLDGMDEIFLAGCDSTLRIWTAAGETYLAGHSDGFFAHAPGSVMPVVCNAPLGTLLVGTVSVGGQGKLYAWVAGDVNPPLPRGQVMVGWPPAIPSVTTSPCWFNDNAIVGCSDGAVYAVNGAGAVDWTSASVSGLPVTGSVAAGYLHGGRPDVVQYQVAYSSGRSLVHCVSSGSGEDVFPPFALPEEAAADTAGPFILMADVDGKPDSTLEVLAVLQSGQAFALDAAGELLAGWPISLGDTVLTWPSAGDVDGDGLVELVIHSAGGRVYVVNGSGAVSSGWPY